MWACDGLFLVSQVVKIKTNACTLASLSSSPLSHLNKQATKKPHRGSKQLERVKGIEPSYAAWEAAVLPLNYTRMLGLHFTASEPLLKTITLNGEIRQFPDALNLTDLIAELGLTGKRIALERNGEIVPRSQFATQLLNEGDQVEIVVAVGGG